MSEETQDQSDAVPPARIPDHELVRCIGRGGSGEVWLARTMMGTYRAVKIVRRSAFKHTRPFDRELAGIRKFEPLSRSHDGFIDLLQVGQNEDEGYFYYVMELGDDEETGQTIDPAAYRSKTLATEIARRHRLPVEECLRLGLCLSPALAHLHEQGLVHRDIKPANIIFVSGAPKLADIGLVTDMEAAASYVGTEGFIPPEGPGMAQADIFSLGKVLYEAATGKDRNEFPELPAELGDMPDPTPFLELNEVIVKACQNKRELRYQSAREMHADLVVLQNGKSVKRLHLLERRWAVLKKVGIGAALLVLLLAAGYFPIAHERQRAAEARQRQIGTLLANGTHAMTAGDLPGALPFLVDALRLDHGDQARERTHRVRLGAVLEQCPKLVQMWFLDKQVNSVAFSPDGDRVVTATWLGRAQLWEVRSGRAISPPFGPSQGLEAAALNPGGDRIVTASADKSVSVWNAETGERLLRLAHPDKVKYACFSPDGRRLLTAGNDRTTRLWEAHTNLVLREFAGHEDIVRHAAFSPDGRFIVTASQDNTAQIWEAETGDKIGPALRHKSWVYHAAFSPDGRQVVTASFDRTARVWDAATGQEILPALPHGDAVPCAVFSPDGGLIVSASWDGNVRIWDAGTHQLAPLNPILKHSSRVMHAAWSPDGRRLISACVDGTIRVWDLAASAASAQPVRGMVSLAGAACVAISNGWVEVRGLGRTASNQSRIVLEAPVQDAALSDDGRFLLTLAAPTAEPTDPRRRLQVWEIPAGKPRSPRLPWTNGLRQVCLSPDGRRCALLAGVSAQACEVATGKAVAPRFLHPLAVVEAHFSPAGHRLLTVAQDPALPVKSATVHLWDLSTGKPLFAPLKHPFAVSHAEFSPDGRFFLTATSDPYLNAHAAQVWNAATGERVGRPLQHRDGVLYATFSPDGRRVVTASEDFTAAVWEATTGRRLTPLLRHEDQVKGAAFSPDSRWVVTASRDRTARVWDAESGDPLTPPLLHPVSLRQARFLGEDPAILTANDQGQAWVWNLPTEARRVEALGLLAQLLNGGPTESGSAGSEPSGAKPGNLSALWQEHRLADPEDSTVSGEDILAWHSRLAEVSEENRAWFPARFHLDRLLKLRPDEAEFLKRRAAAERELRKSEGGKRAEPKRDVPVQAVTK